MIVKLIIIIIINIVSNALLCAMAVHQSSSVYHLPGNTVPIIYRLDFDLDFTGELFTFHGNSTVIFEVIRTISTVTFHKSSWVDIDQSYTEVISVDGNVHKPIKQSWIMDTEFFTLTFEYPLESGNYSLKLKWLGNDTGLDTWDTNIGFFRTADDTDDNENYNK